MPEIELPPSKYRWRRPLSKPLAWFYVLAAVGMLAWIYFTRSGSLTEWVLTVGLSVALGVILAAIFRDIE